MAEQSVNTGQRRPIKAREFKLSKKISHWLAERGVSANAISVMGCLFAILAGLILAMADGSAWSWLAAALLVELRLLCNMFDGMVAIERGTSSRIGEIYNEVPDRLADIAVLVGLGYATGGIEWLGYAAALTAVFTAYIRVFGMSVGARADFGGWMAKPQRMQTIAITAIACMIVSLAGFRYDSILFDLGLPALALVVILFGSIVTAYGRLSRCAAVLQ